MTKMRNTAEIAMLHSSQLDRAAADWMESVASTTRNSSRSVASGSSVCRCGRCGVFDREGVFVRCEVWFRNDSAAKRLCLCIVALAQGALVLSMMPKAMKLCLILIIQDNDLPRRPTFRQTLGVPRRRGRLWLGLSHGRGLGLSLLVHYRLPHQSLQLLC